MASATFLNQFHEDLPHGAHDLGSDQLVVALSPAASPPVVGDAVLADLTEAVYTNCSTRNITTSSSEGSDGSYALSLTDLVLTASGGSVGPFRYITIYNDTQTSPADPLIMFYDYGSDLTLSDGETLTLDFAATTITM